MFKNLLNTFNELNDADRLKESLTSSLDEIKEKINVEDVIKYAGMAANSPVLHILSPKTVRSIQLASMLVERAATAYSTNQNDSAQQPLDYPQEPKPAVDYSFAANQEEISQQKDQTF